MHFARLSDMATYRFKMAILGAVLVLPLGACDMGSDNDQATGQTVEQESTATSDAPTKDQSAPATRPATRPASAAGAGDTDAQAAAEKLHGTWVSVNPVGVSFGAAEIKLTFKDEGPVRIMAFSTLPLVGKVRETSGPYEVNENTITSEAIRNGTSVQYHFEGEQLVIEYKDGKTVRFRRQQ